jgi:5'-methylthioadenosine phosphorylase
MQLYDVERYYLEAESRVWKDVFKADIIGMTLVPEVNLACEAQLCYATIAMVTGVATAYY